MTETFPFCMYNFKFYLAGASTSFSVNRSSHARRERVPTIAASSSFPTAKANPSFTCSRSASMADSRSAP